MNDLWYSEHHTADVRFSIRLRQELHSEKSDYQYISIFDSFEFGRILTLDGVVMLTERDEFVYHDMMVHVPMAVRPDIRRVLLIGGGDGGAARELCRYEQIEHIDVAEIDEAVVRVCREWLPQTACGFDDPRVHLHYVDGLRYIRTKTDEYDLVIVDSTDPSGPGEVLFTKEFYGNCFQALKENGIMVNQHESAFYKEDRRAMQAAHKRIASVFPETHVYQAHIPTYPSGHWLFGFASKKIHPLNDLDAAKWNERALQTQYYNTDLHRGAFYLPNYIKEALKNDE